MFADQHPFYFFMAFWFGIIFLNHLADSIRIWAKGGEDQD